MVFLAFVHLALFLALSLSPGNSLVSSWCDHSTLAFPALTLSNSSLFTPALLKLTHLFSLLSMKPAGSFSVLSSQRRHSFLVPSFQSRTLLQSTLALSLVVPSLKSECCDFFIFSAEMPRSPALCLTWYGIPSYTHHLL